MSDINYPLTIEGLKRIGMNVIADTGITEGGPDGIGVYGRPKEVRWVLKTGMNDDWAIYVGPSKWTAEVVARNGDKAYDMNKIKLVVPCDADAAGRYRK